MDTANPDKSPVLTQDEAILADFIQTRLNKVQADIKDLIASGNEDPEPWQQCFAYMIRTYGRESEEPFRWFKYYLKAGQIPAAAALPVLVQIYMDGAVDAGFANILARVMKKEPEAVRADRIARTGEELADLMDEDGRVTLYRGSFGKPFGTEPDGSRPLEKAFNFTLDEKVALGYAGIWYPAKAVLYEIKAAPEDIAWYSLYDEEKRAILLPQFKGAGWTLVSEKQLTPADYVNKMDEKTAKRAYLETFKR